MNLRHLEWLTEEPVSGSDVILYQIKPYPPADADQIIQHLFVLADFDLKKARRDSARADRIRQAFRLVIDAAREMEALRNLTKVERQFGKWPWRGLLLDLRDGRSQFATVITDKSARLALHWALVDSGFDARAGRRWLHYLRDHPDVLRKTVIRALKAPLLQGDAGRPDRLDRMLLVEGVSRAYELLTGKRLGRNVTSETKTRRSGTPTGRGFELASICLRPLDPTVTDHAVVWTIRRVQARASGPSLSC